MDKQNLYRFKELESLNKERELEKILQKQKEEGRKNIVQNLQQAQNQEFDNLESQLGSRVSQLLQEHEDFAKKERELDIDIKHHYQEIEAEEQFFEGLKLGFEKKQEELLKKCECEESAKAELEGNYQSILKEINEKAKRLSELETSLKKRRKEVENRTREVNNVSYLKRQELRKSQDLTEKEAQEVRRFEDELLCVSQKEQNEKRQFEGEWKRLANEVTRRKSEFENTTDAISTMREKIEAYHVEIEAKLIELQTRESLALRQRESVEYKDRQLAELTNLDEVEREEFETRKRNVMNELNFKEALLEKKQRVLMHESEDIEKMRKDLSDLAESNKGMSKEIDLAEQQMLEEEQRRSLGIIQRQNLLELQDDELKLKKRNSEKQIEKRLQEVQIQQEILEQDRLLIQQREQEVELKEQLKQAEIQKRLNKLEVLRQMEHELFLKNEQVLKSHSDFIKQIDDVEVELQMPSDFDHEVQKLSRRHHQDLRTESTTKVNNSKEDMTTSG